MAYIALKPCAFAGRRFNVGDEIPGELIVQGNEKNLIKMGKIAVQGIDAIADKHEQAPQTPQTVEIELETEKGAITLDVSKSGLQSIFDALTSNVKDAEEIIHALTDNDALILLHAADSRKSVKELAEEQAKALKEAGE